MRFRIPRHREYVDVRSLDASHREAGTNGLRRKARPVFDAPKTLLFNGGDERTVAHERGRDIAMVGIDAQDVHSDVLREVVASEPIIREPPV
jgi:hypothetical protein